MAALMFSSPFASRYFSVFRRSPLVSGRNKSSGRNKDDVPSPEPKLPPKPFALFLKKKLEHVKQEHPGANFKDLMAIASTAWKQLPESEKEKYCKQYQAEFNEYVNTMYEHYQQTKNSETKPEDSSYTRKSIIRAWSLKMGKPSPPKSAFLNFAMEHAQKVGKPFLIPNGIIEGREKWSQLTDLERSKYIMEARIERERYQEKLLQWEKKMMEDGHDLLVRAKSVKQFKTLTAIDP